MQAAEPTVLGHHIPWSFPRLEEGRFPSFIFSLSVFQKRHRSLTEAYINELNLFSDASALDWSLPGTLNYYTAQWMMRADAAQR